MVLLIMEIGGINPCIRKKNPTSRVLPRAEKWEESQAAEKTVKQTSFKKWCFKTQFPVQETGQRNNNLFVAALCEQHTRGPIQAQQGRNPHRGLKSPAWHKHTWSCWLAPAGAAVAVIDSFVWQQEQGCI